MLHHARQYRAGILLLELGILFCVSTLLLAQSALCKPIIELSPTLCSQSSCTLFHQIDEADSTYVLNPKTGVVIVYQQNGLVAGQYTIPSEILPIKGFVPFSGDSILLLNGKALYQYHLDSLSLTDITPPNTRLVDCTNPALPGNPIGLTRIGLSNKVVLCSLGETHTSYGETWIVYIFDVDSRSLTDISHLNTRFGQYGWDSVIAGQDGKVYFPGYNGLDAMNGIGLPPSSRPPMGVYSIYQYDPQTAAWAAILLASDFNLQYVNHLVFVDKNSNLYYQNYSANHFSYAKVTASGVLDWVAGKQELGSNLEILIGMRSDNRLSFTDWPTSGIPGTIHVCTISSSVALLKNS